MTKSIWEKIKKYQKKIVGAITVFGAIIAILDWLFKTEILSRSWNFIRNLSFLEISLVSLGVSIVLNLFFLFFKKTPKETNQDSVRDRLNNAYDKAKWNLVIKIAQTMSRPLWLLGLYDMRVDYLKKGIKAAESNEEETNKEQAKFHLDIGWTKFTIYQKTKEGDVDKAIQDIKEGIETAEENISEEKQHKKDRYYQLIVEGYRHLVGIYIHKRNMSEIKKNMVLAVENWNKITEDNSWKGKVKMGIDEAKGHVEIAKGNIKKAIVIFERVQKQYEKVGDRDRAVKMYNYIGNACLENEQNHKAKKNFLEGHQKSLSWGRAESQYSNAKDLYQYYKKTEETEETNEWEKKMRDAETQIET